MHLICLRIEAPVRISMLEIKEVRLIRGMVLIEDIMEHMTVAHLLSTTIIKVNILLTR
jgi:hypothetical protein